MQRNDNIQPPDDAPSAHPVNLQELPPQRSTGVRLLDGNLSIISGVKVKVEVVVGGAEMTVGDLIALEAGSVVSLDQLCDAPLILRLDGRTVAHGTLVVVDDHFGIRISEVLPASATA